MTTVYQGYYTYQKCLILGWMVNVTGDLEQPEWVPLSEFNLETLNLMLRTIPPVMYHTDIRQTLATLIFNYHRTADTSPVTPPTEAVREPRRELWQSQPDDRKPFKRFLITKEKFMEFTENTDNPIFIALREQIRLGNKVDLQPVSKYF